MGESEPKPEPSLKDQGNEFFKSGNYLKAAALYTQAVKKDPDNPTLYSNRAAAFLHLVKLNKALADAETTISLKPDWEKGYFRKGCVLEAMERYDDVVSKFNPQSSEVSKKIKRLSQLEKDKKRAQEVETIRANLDMSKHLDSVKTEPKPKMEGAGDIVIGENFGPGAMERAKDEENESRSGSDNNEGASGDDQDAPGDNSARRKKYHSAFKKNPHPDEKARLDLGRRLSLESKQGMEISKHRTKRNVPRVHYSEDDDFVSIFLYAL